MSVSCHNLISAVPIPFRNAGRAAFRRSCGLLTHHVAANSKTANCTPRDTEHRLNRGVLCVLNTARVSRYARKCNLIYARQKDVALDAPIFKKLTNAQNNFIFGTHVRNFTPNVETHLRP